MLNYYFCDRKCLNNNFIKSNHNHNLDYESICSISNNEVMCNKGFASDGGALSG